MTDAFFVPDGDAYRSTAWCRGPWSPDAQHAGPPAALLGRAVEAIEPEERWRVARFTLEILRPVPIAALRTEARVTRPGRRVQLVDAALSGPDGLVARAAAWRIRPGPGDLPETALEPVDVPPPEACDPWTADIVQWHPSYLAAMEWRPGRGSFVEPGPCACWMRMRVPLVAGEVPTGLQRVLAAADSGNGISSVFSPGDALFINTDLTVHVVRDPIDEWVLLDSVTRIDPAGLGLAETTLADRRGRIGVGAQSLLVARGR